MRLPVGRQLGGALFLACGMLFLASYPGAFGQTTAKPTPKEEEEAPAKQKKGPVKEEERSTPPAGKQVPRVGDEDAEAAAPKPGLHDPDLSREAARAGNRYVRQLFQSLSPPHDLLTQPDGATVRLDPVPRFFPPETKTFDGLTVTPRRGPGKKNTPFRLDSTNARRVQGFEQVVLEKVDDFLKIDPGKEQPGSPDFMSRLDMLQAAEKALVAGILFHRSAKETGKREGPGWIDVEKRLEKRLIEVQAEQVRILTNTKNWKAAFALEAHLANAYSGQGNTLAEPMKVEIIHLLASHAKNAIESQDYDSAISRLRILQERFPGDPAIQTIRAELGKYAKLQLEEAEKLRKEGKRPEAMAKLRTAIDIDPQLPGLQDQISILNDQYPVLRVGVRALPTYLSPARARTEAERQAVELIFEGLVGLSQRLPGGERYEPELSAEPPRIVSLARRFTLPRSGSWSDGKWVRGTDVSHTHRLLTTGKGRMRDVAWAELMGERPEIVEDNFHVTLKMKQGYFDPLSLMDFKILPESLTQLDDENFARHPVGTGPFRVDRREGEQLVLTANSYYSARPGKKDRPLIREIRFVVPHDQVAEFRDQQLQLMFDLSAASAKELQAAAVQANIKVFPLASRRITFLAVNHREERQSALRNVALRRGLAHAIKRNQILDECFREGMKPTPHHELFGPYPQGTWAAKPDPHPYSIDTARAQFDKAKSTLTKETKLSLKYPDGDPAVENACTQIKAQIQALEPSLTIDLIKLSPEDLRRDVEVNHDYDLAYYTYEFPNQTFWLWPLFESSKDSTDPGGSNFLGYKDAILESALRKQLSYCDFADVQAQALDIYERCWDQMPFIPLWQLDSYLAVHRNLLLPEQLDGLAIFRDIDSWVLKKD